MPLLRRAPSQPDAAVRTAALRLAYARVAIGALFVVAPRRPWRALAPAEESLDTSATPLRGLGARDVVLGLGAVLAARRGDPSLRDWIRAGALADSADAVLFAGDRRLRAVPRLATAVLAVGGAVMGLRTARELGD